ncbi:MAG: hypothetical protein AAGB05_04385 [Pseudomonadota bacterium]
MSASPKDPFFIGFLPAPAGLRPFLISTMLSVVAFFAALGAMMALSQDDPGDGSFRFDLGRQTVTGVLETTPYPIVHITEGNETIPRGHTLMVSGQGKNGAIGRGAPLNGQLVTISGVLLTRGDLDMMQLRGGRNGLAAAETAEERAAPAEAPAPEPLGTWRLAGEICDGKCLAGAMRPGRGLSHKACADLCIEGGIPPVFVSSQPVAGEEFLLITGPEGTPLPEAARDWIATFVHVEGEITRHGSLLVFAIDPNTLEPIE